MKKYFFTVVLILLVITGLFLVLKDKKTNRIIKLPSVDTNETNTTNKTNTDDFITDNKETSVKEIPVDQGLTLEVSSPKDKETVGAATVLVQGKTSPNAEVFVNEKEVKADSSGNFSVNYELFEGENSIYVAVNDDKGNYTEKTITVYLETTE